MLCYCLTVNERFFKKTDSHGFPEESKFETQIPNAMHCAMIEAMRWIVFIAIISNSGVAAEDDERQDKGKVKLSRKARIAAKRAEKKARRQQDSDNEEAPQNGRHTHYAHFLRVKG